MLGKEDVGVTDRMIFNPRYLLVAVVTIELQRLESVGG